MSGMMMNGSASVQAMFMPNAFDMQTDDRWTGRFYWSYEMRHIRLNREQYHFFACWPRSRGSAGDPGTLSWALGQDVSDGGMYEPVGVPDSGSYRPQYIVGTVKDGSGSVLGAAEVDVYLTGSNTWVCTVFTDSNGIYSAPTVNVGLNHYLVANYGPNTLVGASVNTITPGSNPWG